MNTQPMIRFLLLSVSIVLTVVVTTPQSAQAATFTVTNTNDSGEGSLRQAITNANSNPGTDAIIFNILPSDPGYGLNTSGVWTIRPQSLLPSLTGSGGVIIDGTTQTSNRGNTNPLGPEIEIDGRNLSSTAAVFYLDSNSNIILGLTINGVVIDSYTHPGVGIQISSPVSGNLIANNYIGTDATGLYARPTNTGIEIFNGAQSNIVSQNVIAGNTLDGIAIMGTGTDYNEVKSNGIGVSWGNAIPNGRHGVFIMNGPIQTIVGGDGFRNYISGNALYGVYISNAHWTQVWGNYIGVGIDGNGRLSNGWSGVGIDAGSTNSFIYGNVIGGNNRHGVWISDNGTTDNAVQGNIIGANEQVTAKALNGWHGIAIYNGAASNLIGHYNDPSRGNVIVGSGWSGVAVVNSSGNTIAHNAIGTNKIGTVTDLGNGFYGIIVGSDNTIGPSNLIAYNGSDGVRVDGASSLHNRITQNSIYSNGGKGIENINGGNSEPFAPNIYQATCGYVQGSAAAGSTVEIFSDTSDEGRIYEGSTTANAILPAFEWFGTIHGPNVTVTYFTSQGNTSEFGVRLGVCYRLSLPLIRR